MYLLSSIGGLIAIPIFLLVCSAVSFYKGYKQWVSGTIVIIRDINGIPIREEERKERMGYFEIGANIFGIMFLVFAIISYLIMWFEK